MNKVLIFDSKEKAEKTVAANKIVKLQIDDQRICLARRGGEFYAFEEKCPHMSEDLGKGRINPLGEVVCPWHDYRFNMASGEEADSRCRDLKRYELLWEADQLFVMI
ncbi:Rieske (2Fe-2S) protein [Reichenbachiella ulvae]|uniref:Rieske (2Fe-2S) protein n=1 Tax=Reichenbachiella ulvae TaxID=2980104 RepID=A0ABT3CXV6_9BACT|nr:Rieske (2Fe-2S) protein [Reichenbachiella ulvae]MCV9388369.1 Rieske (2Fe-2S) protein [Reichenbachiella ulvae]